MAHRDSDGAGDTSSRPKGGGCAAGLLGGGFIAALVCAALVAGPVWLWYWWRIEPDNGQFAVLISKTGTDLPSGEIVATTPGQKGVQLEVIPEGRYFRNPYDWNWKYCRMTDIPAGKLGVKTRLFGKDLPSGEIIAPEGVRGIMPEVLGPGKYRINPFAYEVSIHDAINLRPGCVGVKISLVGKDILNASLPQSERDTFLVTSGMKGVCPEVLDPGTHYLNPYIWAVVEVNLQSQRFEMSGDDSIVFLTSDGFTVKVEGTIEYNVRRSHAALLTHQVGDMEDIIKKLIMPRARGFSRIEGSKKPAVDFIVGETRQEFQNNLDKHLREKCDPFGVSVNSVLIRNIIPPDEISVIIRDRELAAQEAKKFEQQIEQAKSRAELVRQQMLAEQNSKKVEAETQKLKAEIAAKQDQSVKITAGEREKEVAEIGRKTAEAEAKAKVVGAEAERDVIRLSNEAEAKVLATKVAAFGGGMGWARYNLYGKLAPRIKGLMVNDETAGAVLPLGTPPRDGGGASKAKPATAPSADAGKEAK